MSPSCRAVAVVMFVAACCVGRRADALGTETIGNESLNELNYAEWVGVMPLVNHPARVYQRWVNGGERLLFRGDAAALNECLAHFAKVEAKEREVVLRPGPAVGRSFHGTEDIPYGWALRLNGGISKFQTTLDKGDQVWRIDPVLTVYVGGDVKLADIQVPEGVTFVDVRAVAKRVSAAVTTSTDTTVRGWGCGELAGLDPYSEENAKTVAGMLDDPDDWVRRCAAGALRHFGRTAEPHLPALRKLLDSGDANLVREATETINAIEAAPDKRDERREHAATRKVIEAFIASPPEPRAAALPRDFLRASPPLFDLLENPAGADDAAPGTKG